MQESEFQEAVDEIFMSIEDQLEELDEELDIDSAAGVLTLTFENGSQVILSRQVSALEIWVAARSGGFHLHREGENWICRTTGEELQTLLNRVMAEQGGFTLPG